MSGSGTVDPLRLRRWLQHPMNRRALLRGSMAVAGGGALASLLAACGGSGDTPTSTGSGQSGASGTPAAASPTSQGFRPVQTQVTQQGKRGGLLRVAIIGEPPAFDPTFTTATVTANTTWHVFETLWAPDASFSPKELLLDSYEVQDEGKVFILKLRDGVKFHNGKRMGADDVIASLERYSVLSGRGKTLFARVEGLDKVDDLTVRLAFKEPTGIAPVFLAKTDAIIIPKEIADASHDGEMSDFIGTGPYKMKERLPDRYISLVRFEDYLPLEGGPDGYGGTKIAYFDEIRFIPVPETAVRGDGLITDEFDFAEGLSTDNYDSLSAEPDIQLQIVLPYYFYGAHFNKAQESIMSNRDIRMALLTAIDMEPVAAAGFGRPEFYRLGPEFAAPETAWYTDAGKEFYDLNDPEKARQMLQAAGYDGRPIRWIATKEYAYNYNMAVVLKEQMERAGAVIDLQVMDWATLVATRSQRDAWDIFITGHESYSHPILQPFLNESWPGFWSNPKKDELMTKIIEEPDPDKQMEYIAQLQHLWWEDAAMIKVCEGATLRGYRKRLKGWVDPADWFFWNVWFEE
ncbi:MAG: ABC transporter substrate-binding protein [Sphaerobacter sp.]|nr:ABC transporter substrate-binding protein [Sphaerobacter sp.]